MLLLVLCKVLALFMLLKSLLRCLLESNEVQLLEYCTQVQLLHILPEYCHRGTLYPTTDRNVITLLHCSPLHLQLVTLQNKTQGTCQLLL